MVRPQSAKRIRHEPMSGVDRTWLRMERANNLMMITGVLVLETPLTIDRLRRVIAGRRTQWLQLT